MYVLDDADSALRMRVWPVPVQVYDNSLSALAAAELTRRIALHREVDPSLRFPGATWRDIQVGALCESSNP